MQDRTVQLREKSVMWEGVACELFKSTDERCVEKPGIHVQESQSTCRPIFGFSNVISNLIWHGNACIYLTL